MIPGSAGVRQAPTPQCPARASSGSGKPSAIPRAGLHAVAKCVKALATVAAAPVGPWRDNLLDPALRPQPSYSLAA